MDLRAVHPPGCRAGSAASWSSLEVADPAKKEADSAVYSVQLGGSEWVFGGGGALACSRNGSARDLPGTGQQHVDSPWVAI